MTHRGPVVTAIVVVAGLVGFMTANSAGALVATKAANKSSDVQVPAPPGSPQGGNDKSPKSPDQPKKPEKPKAPEEPKAPPAPTFPAEAVYTGDATESDLAIAVAVKGEEASGYLCDGSAVEDWLKGNATDGKLDLKSKNNKSHLTASLKGKRLVGSVTFHGQTRPFSIAVGEPPTGLYRGKNGETEIGWIILPNGKQVGIENSAGEEKPAPMLDPDMGYVTVDGQRIDAQQVAGDTSWG